MLSMVCTVPFYVIGLLINFCICARDFNSTTQVEFDRLAQEYRRCQLILLMKSYRL